MTASLRSCLLLVCVCWLCARTSAAHAIDVDDIRARLRVEPGATYLTAQRHC